GFVGEFLSLIGTFKVNRWGATLATIGIILSVCYALWLYRQVIFGTLDKPALAALKDLNFREVVALAPLVLLTLLFGVFPNLVLNVSATRSRPWSRTTPHPSTPRKPPPCHHPSRASPMTAPPQLSAFTAIAPELLLAIGAMALLMLGAFRGERVANIADAVAIAILIAAALIVARLPDGKPAALGGSFVIDEFARFLKILAIVGAAATILMSFDYSKRQMRPTFEYSVIILLSVTGMLMLISASDLIALYLGLELMSLS